MLQLLTELTVLTISPQTPITQRCFAIVIWKEHDGLLPRA